MRKIPTMFVRDWDGDPRYVLDTIEPGCEWVLEGLGTPTRKWDGTCVMLDVAGDWWARREVKPGKTPPTRYQVIEHDPETGKTAGWEPLTQSPFAKIHAEALATHGSDPAPGTYELVGPKINQNPDRFAGHLLLAHGWTPFSERLDLNTAPRDYSGLATWLADRPYEGIVWHHEDGRMAKIKRKDFRR